MKIFHMDNAKRSDIEQWLTENIGPKNQRWWANIVLRFTADGEIFHGRSLEISLDLTEQEEEEFLTVFLLSNV